MAEDTHSRRLTTIVALDMAGYSARTEADEVRSAAEVAGLRAIVEEIAAPRGGRVFSSAGDGFMLEFGSSLAAVEVALALAERCEPKVRIGVHLGDVAVQPNGDLLGHGVNVAARLMALSDPGSALVSADVRRTIRGPLAERLVSRGILQLDKMAEAIEAFAPAAAGSAVAAAPSMSREPLLAVLPFDNMSDDREMQFFSDGVSEEIIQRLSRGARMKVIGRTSSFQFRGADKTARKVANELKCTHILDGSIRRAGGRVRIAVHLLESVAQTTLWSDRYDRDLEDIFAVQDEVAEGIVSTLQSRLLHAEFQVARRQPPEALDAWGNVVQAKVKLFAYRRQDLDEAEPFARKAVHSDSSYGEAHSTLGHLLAWRSYNGWCADWYATAKEAVGHLDRAAQLSPQDPTVLTDIGFGSWVLGRFLKAVPPLERALQLNPNSAVTAAVWGLAVASVGRPDEGIEKIKLALRLSPKDPLEHLFNSYLAHAEFFGGRYEDARRSAERALKASPDLVHALVIHAAACVRSGDRAQAGQTVRRVERLSATAIDNLFRPRTDGTLWAQYTAAMREAMGRAPRV